MVLEIQVTIYLKNGCESALTLAFSDDLPFGDEFGGVLTSAVGLGNF